MEQTIGKRRRKTLRKWLTPLQVHHSFDLAALHPILRQLVMTWHCKTCNHSNPISSDRCHTCKAHWKQAWQRPSGRSASRTKPRTPRQRKEIKDKPSARQGTAKEALADPSHAVFPSKVPWVPNTPQTRMNPRQVELQPSGSESPALPPVPPQPILTPPPPAPSGTVKESLTAEEQAILTHMKGLVEAGCPLPDQMQETLKSLEEKAQVAQPAQQTLSHGHLNQLHRLQKQLQACLKRITDVDEEWRQFIQEVSARVHNHACWYQAHRQELVGQYEKKKQELENLKHTVSQASMSLVEATEAPDTPQDMPEVVKDVGQINQLISGLGAVPVLSMGEGDEEDDVELMEQETAEAPPGPKGTKRVIQPRPFAASRSPSKVSQGHLKTKQEK